MAQTSIAVVMGSDSDWPTMQACVAQLAELGLDCEVQIMSAHRTPQKVQDFARSAAERGLKVIIAAAGLAAGLPGMIASHTALPVIGVPMASGPLQGVDALLSMVQMPPGVPVATVGLGQIGAKNAALLAAQILSLQQATLAEAVRKFRREMAESVDKKNQLLRERLARGAEHAP